MDEDEFELLRISVTDWKKQNKYMLDKRQACEFERLSFSSVSTFTVFQKEQVENVDCHIHTLASLPTQLSQLLNLDKLSLCLCVHLRVYMASRLPRAVFVFTSLTQINWFL